MMTPRGVADVNVYTPERVELRYGVRPDQVPDFIGLKGDTSDNIPGVPGIGDKTAGQLIAQYGSLESVIEHADELSPARAKNILEHAEQARDSKVLATMRRDLELDCDPSQLVLAPPDRSQLREIFRRFEFRNLLNRVDKLDEAVPAAAPVTVVGTEVAWREGELPAARGRVGLAIADGRVALAQDDGVVVGSWDPALLPRLREARDRRPRRQVAAAADDAAGRRHDDRRVPDRAGPLRVRARRPLGRVRARGRPRTGGGGGDGGADPPRGGAAPPRADDARAGRRAGLAAPLRRDRAAADGRARRDGGRGRPDRHVPDGRDHGAARRPRRGARGAGVRACRARSSCSARRSRWPASCSRSSS